VRPELLEAGPEQDLYDEVERIGGRPIETVIAALRPKVDLFFDKVLVNAQDPQVRRNRLALLHNLLGEFKTFADFSEIVTSSVATAGPEITSGPRTVRESPSS
jgi:glycyl-tRNA synthetase beta subunit